MIKTHLRKDCIRFAVFAFLMILLCVGSAWDYLYSNSRNTVTVDNVESQLLSVSGHEITQELRLEGELKELLFFCVAPSGAAYQDASVTITVNQNDEIFQKTVQAKEIGATYKVKLPLLKFLSGTVTLNISGKDFPEGTDLFLMVSKTEASRLQAAQMNGNITPGPLLMHYTVMRHDNYFVYDTVFLLMLVAIIVLIAWLVTFRKEKLTESMGLFFCSFLLLFVYISLTNPLATFLAEPHSEMVYEFWYKARYLSFTDNLMSLMSGESLAWTERLMMWAAVQLAGDGKCVFVIAQLMQTAMICCVSSMFCIPTFRRWFPAELRLLVCWYIGGAMLFPSAYYFWAVSYWTSFFLIPFAFVDMEKLPRWQYGLALVATVILCVSRIYHILYIPMALLALLVLGKMRGKRFSWYCILVAVASAFEVIYSMTAGGGGHVDISLLKPLQFLENAVYYQVQVLSSLFFGSANLQASFVNVFFLLFFVGVLAVAIWLVIAGWNNLEKRTYGTILMGLGILSFGSVLINVTVCGCSTSVGFPHDYAAQVDWGRNYYQTADLHFSYSYFAVISIFLVLICGCKRALMNWQQETVSEKYGFNQGIVTLILLGVITCTAVNPQSRYTLRIIPMDWKSYHWVTENESYYMPVNSSYQFANISMYHNSTSVICGMTNDGQEAAWQQGQQAYSATYYYNTISPGKVSDLQHRGMLSLSANKTNMNFADPIILILRDEAGNEIERIPQTNSAERYRLEFMLEEPMRGVYSVEFQYEDGSPAYVCDGVQIGVTLA